MILGMSIGAFTLLHVVITLVEIGSGLIVVGGMFASNRLPLTTALFLFTTALTSVTGFLFPIHGLTPALRVGILACMILAVALAVLPLILASHADHRRRTAETISDRHGTPSEPVTAVDSETVPLAA